MENETNRIMTIELLKKQRGEMVGLRRKVDFREEPLVLQGQLLFGDVRDDEYGREIPDRKSQFYLLVGHYRGFTRHHFSLSDEEASHLGPRNNCWDGWNTYLQNGDEIEIYSIGTYRPGENGWYKLNL